MSSPTEQKRATSILWFDSGAGVLAGCIVLALHGLLAGFYGLPERLIVFIGVTNVAYGLFSGTLARRVSRGSLAPRWVDALIAANLLWAVVCICMLIATWSTSSVFGVAQLVGEAAFVTALAGVEARWARPHFLVERARPHDP